MRTPLPKRGSAVKSPHHATGKPGKELLSHAQECLAEGHELRDKGRHLVQRSQDLRQKFTMCPVCKDRTIAPIKGHVLLVKKGKEPLPGKVVGYRCSRGHTFFAAKMRGAKD